MTNPTLTRSEANLVATKFLNELETAKFKACAIRNHLGTEFEGLPVKDAVERAPQGKLAELISVITDKMVMIVG